VLEDVREDRDPSGVADHARQQSQLREQPDAVFAAGRGVQERPNDERRGRERRDELSAALEEPRDQRSARGLTDVSAPDWLAPR
jgi:hypothetical protein